MIQPKQIAPCVCSSPESIKLRNDEDGRWYCPYHGPMPKHPYDLQRARPQAGVIVNSATPASDPQVYVHTVAQPQVEPYDDPRELLRGAMGYMDVSDTESRDLWGRIKDYLAGPVAQTQEWASEPDIEALITLLLDNRLSLNQKNLIASMLRQLAVQPASEPTNE